MTEFKKKLSVITVTLNAADALAITLKSVNNQKYRAEIEFIVIDGLSKDASVALLVQSREDIDILISAKDRNVYDAMNKGIQESTCEWIYFLNAGDEFLNENSLSSILDRLDNSDVLYSDVVVNKGSTNETFHTSFEDRKLNHQGFVYRRELHEKFGPYSVIKGFTAADYFFFLQLHSLRVKKLDQPIAIFKAGGLSSTVNAVHQKYCLDFLAGKIGVVNLAIRLIIYPYYRVLKNLFR